MRDRSDRPEPLRAIEIRHASRDLEFAGYAIEAFYHFVPAAASFIDVSYDDPEFVALKVAKTYFFV